MSDACDANHDGDGETLLASPFEMAIERHVIHTLGTRPCWEEGWRRQIRATNSESPFQTSWRIGGAVAHGAVGRPVHRVCLRGLRSKRLHDSIPPVDCHGNQVKPVIQVPRNFLVLWLQRATRGQKDGKSVQESSIVVAAPGLLLLRSGWWRRWVGSGCAGWSDGRILGVALWIVESGGVLED